MYTRSLCFTQVAKDGKKLTDPMRKTFRVETEVYQHNEILCRHKKDEALSLDINIDTRKIIQYVPSKNINRIVKQYANFA